MFRRVLFRSANIPFHATRFVYYQEALDSVASIGPDFKGPSYHDLRGPLLQKHVKWMVIS